MDDEQGAVAPAAEDAAESESFETAIDALTSALAPADDTATPTDEATAGAAADADKSQPQTEAAAESQGPAEGQPAEDWKAKYETADKDFKSLQAEVQRLKEAERARQRDEAQRQEAAFQESLRHMSPEMRELVLRERQVDLAAKVVAARAAKVEHDGALTEIGMRSQMIQIVAERSGLDQSDFAEATTPDQVLAIERAGLRFKQRFETQQREAQQRERAEDGADAFAGANGGAGYSGKAPETIEDANAMLARLLR